MLVFNEANESLVSLTAKIRDKLSLPDTYRLLMLLDGGKIDEIEQIMFDDKIEICTEEQEQ